MTITPIPDEQLPTPDDPAEDEGEDDFFEDDDDDDDPEVNARRKVLWFDVLWFDQFISSGISQH
jgi:hypothetical protein